MQTVSEETLPIIRKIFLALNLGRRQLKIWVFVADITNEFILWLNILGAYESFVGLGRQMLRLAVEDVSQWSPGAGARYSTLVVATIT
jgi:hypothetical protein